jgi:hypothetical protein
MFRRIYVKNDKISSYLFFLVTLLSGARNVKNNYLSQQIYDRMKKVFPYLSNPLISGAIMLANVYASSGDIEKALDIRNQLKQSGAKKKISLTWTVVNGEVFVSILFIFQIKELSSDFIRFF